MYALIYDEHNLGESQKKVISVHGTRDECDEALSRRQNDLGKSVYECNTRVVWTDKAVATDDLLDIHEFVTWRADEDIPEGELNSDSD